MSDSWYECRWKCTTYHCFSLCISIGYCSSRCDRMRHFLNIHRYEKHNVLFGHVNKWFQLTIIRQPHLIFVGNWSALCAVVVWFLETKSIKINNKVKIFLINCFWNKKQKNWQIIKLTGISNYFFQTFGRNVFCAWHVCCFVNFEVWIV